MHTKRVHTKSEKRCTQSERFVRIQSERYSDFTPLEPKKTQGLSLVKGSNHRKFIGGKYKVNTKKMQREKANRYVPETYQKRTRITLRFAKVQCWYLLWSSAAKALAQWHKKYNGMC